MSGLRPCRITLTLFQTQDINVIQTIADALDAQGYHTLTPVQEAVTDPALAEADLLVSAQTGSGKTVAFGMAIAPTLLEDGTHFGPAAAPIALVIAPTRELAMQVARELSWLYGPAGATVTTCVGGMDQRTERRALERGAHVVVATPGRLCDHIKRGNVDLGDLRAVVLDEADEMLDLGFREELEFILSEAPEERRTLMFSATVPPAIAKLAQSFQRDAQRIETRGEERQHTDIEYRAMDVHPRDTENAIINILRFYEARNAIVFCNTRAAVARLTTKFTNRGFSVVALSGELTQSERSNALQALRDGRARVCIATDVAARGIDLPNLELVVHADLPTNAETLLHRSGRTGRAGRKGVSALIVPPKVRGKAKRLLGWAKLDATWGPAPSAEEVTAADEARLLEDPAFTAPVPEDAQAFVDRLTERFTADQLAAAFVNLFRARASAPEDLTDPGEKDDRPRPAFGDSVWFALSMGRDQGAEPRRILPMLCRKGDLTKDDIGAIRVRDDQSYVQVLESAVPKLKQTLGPDMRLEDGVVATQLDAAPDFIREPQQDRRGSGGGRPARGPGGKPGRKPSYDPDAPSAPRARPASREGFDKKPGRPKDDAPRKPKGERPPKSHKTERSPMKPGAKPKPKADGTGKPKAKAVWKKAAPKAEAAPSKPKGRTQAGGAKGPERKGGDKPYNRASDTSKRFTPPGKAGKPGGKPARSKGGDATPKRGKNSFRPK